MAVVAQHAANVLEHVVFTAAKAVVIVYLEHSHAPGSAVVTPVMNDLSLIAGAVRLHVRLLGEETVSEAH
ncbi:MAG: hypothetical protein AMXMBFR84_21680 [Candidatus Hydrogenedentota bacterium]